jgi:chloramphenicol-sensitive protein RarD
MEKKEGYLYAIGAFAIWGLFPIYWKLLSHFSPIELTAYRIIWSFLTLFFFLVFQISFLPTVREFLEGKTFVQHLISTVLIGINWFLFIYAVNNGNILQASFGYFIGPLFSVMIGIFFLKEEIDKFKLTAIILMIIAVSIRTLHFSGFPWIALVLGLSFSLYGLMRKYITTSSVQSVTYETFLMFIPSFVTIFNLEINNKGHYLSASSIQHLLLLMSGVVTITPLILFSAGAKRIPLNSLGFIQYLAPSLQFLCAFFLYDEKMNANQWISFGIIWLACALLIYNAQFSKSVKEKVTI